MPGSCHGRRTPAGAPLSLRTGTRGWRGAGECHQRHRACIRGSGLRLAREWRPRSPGQWSAAGGVVVVVDVRLPEMLCLGVDVRLMIVFDGRVIVLVRMSGGHVFPLGAVPEVVHDVSMLVAVNDSVVSVLHDLLLATRHARTNLHAASRQAPPQQGPRSRARAARDHRHLRAGAWP